jgi:hypothetical protein
MVSGSGDEISGFNDYWNYSFSFLELKRKHTEINVFQISIPFLLLQ